MATEKTSCFSLCQWCPIKWSMSSQETCSSLHLTSVGQKSRGNLLRLLLLYCCCIYFCVCSCSVPDFCEGSEPQTNMHSTFDVKPTKHSKKRVFCCITEDRLFMAVDAYQALALDSIPMDEVVAMQTVDPSPEDSPVLNLLALLEEKYKYWRRRRCRGLKTQHHSSSRRSWAGPMWGRCMSTTFVPSTSPLWICRLRSYIYIYVIYIQAWL